MHRPRRKNEPENRPSSESGGEHNSASNLPSHQRDSKSIKIENRDKIYSVAYIVDGKHIVSGGDEGTLRRWRVEDGKEVGKPIDAGGTTIRDIAVSHDGMWVVSGTRNGQVTVLNTTSHPQVTQFQGHSDPVNAVDISPDSERIATGSDDKTVCIWSLSTDQRLLGPLKHDYELAAVRFSPDGRLIATATWNRSSVRIYDSRNGRLLVDIPIQVNSGVNQSLAWTSDSKQLFALSCDGIIICLDASTGATLSKWRIHSNYEATCIALASSGTFIAASANSSVSFWDTATHKQIGPVINHTHFITSMAISATYDFVTGGDKEITLRNLRDDVSAPASKTRVTWRSSRKLKSWPIKVENADLQDGIQFLRAQDTLSNEKIANLARTVKELRNQLTTSQSLADLEKDGLKETINSLRAHLRTRDESSDGKIAHLDKTVQELRNQLVTSQRAANRKEDSLNEVIKSLRAVLRARDEGSNDKIVHLDKTVQELRDQLATSRHAAKQKEDSLNEVIKSLRAELHVQDEGSNGKIMHLDKTVQELRDQLVASQRAANQQKGNLNETIMSLRADLHTQEKSSGKKIANLEKTAQEFRNQLVTSQRAAGQTEDSLIRIIRAHEKKHQCEALYARGRIYDAAKSLLEITDTISEDPRANKIITDCLAEFKHRCVTTLERVGDEASDTGKHDEAVDAYSTALSLSPSTPRTILVKWVRAMLIRGSAHEATNAATKFKLPEVDVYQTICDILEGDGHIMEAIRYFRQMQSEQLKGTSSRGERERWEFDFRGRCIKKLEKLGDIAMDSKNHDVAIVYYSNALSFDATNISAILVKCCKARAGLLEDALIDATKVIELDPSSYKGYKRKYVVLHGMRRHREAFKAFEMMLSALENSHNLHVRKLRRQYVDATPLIRGVIEQTIRDIPRVLIDMTTGRLCDKTQQAGAFEELPIYDELRSLMITRDRLDHLRIRREVEMFYRYVMLSHKWQPNEPTFQMVENVSIYGLPASPTNIKLLRFCELVCSLDFKWAWSDTCCVNQADRGVQQESVVAMFRWYRGSSLTVVHLLGVFSKSQEPGCLWKSIWNARGWTYQEYVASEVVQFYTEDWKPYLGLDTFNHKESPIILSEMEQVMNFAPQELATLRPGLDMVREKLYLASKRQTTREEDAAYSLFGIFDVAIPVIYGEGKQAVRRLLEHILTRSDNVTLLSWIGNSGSSYNTYLPADLTVYDQIVPPHLPRPIETAEMDGMVTSLRSSLPDLSLTASLYEWLHNLPPLSLVAGRLRLPGIVFPLTDLVPISEPDSDSNLPVYRATTPILGNVRIKTMDDLTGMEGLLLIHPWISPLLDQDFSSGSSRFDLAARALRLVVRLRQPFGALLLASLGRVQYRRVATDSLIVVQVRKETSLTELMDSIRTVDIQ